MSELCSVSVNTGLFTVITVSCEPLSQSTKVQDILEKYGSHVQAFACINPMLQANLRRPDGELKFWERLHGTEDLVEDGLLSIHRQIIECHSVAKSTITTPKNCMVIVEMFLK